MIRPKVGHINFLNILPLTWAYRRGLAKDLSIFPGVPAEINALMKNNLLDVSMMSSIEYARQSENLLLLPDVCIRAKKNVTSIILLSKKPIEKLHGEKVLITTKSATAHCLLKIILSESYGIVPEYATENLTPENPVPGDAAAALFIGDDALYLYLHEKNFLQYDLGAEWYKLTGSEMVYAVFAARKNFAETSPELLQTVYEKISAGLKEGIKNKSAAINSVLPEKNFTFDELNEYLGGVIKWDLTDEGLTALKKFYSLANKINLLEKIPDLEQFSKIKTHGLTGNFFD